MIPVEVGSVVVGGPQLVLIAGPCVLEEPDRVLRIAQGIAEACAAVDLPWIFKSSFDKANRTSEASFRGPGLHEGLRQLQRVGEAVGVPVTTDVHTPEQAAAAAQAVELLQVPAFLCRQTDLVVACGATGRPVNIKKGQFAAPEAMAHAVQKAGGPGHVLLTERGTTFGYGDLVVDMRSLPRMRSLGVPVVMDATHGVQRPGARGDRSGGDRTLAPALARAAVAVGVDAVFVEVHDAPSEARSDAATQLPLAELPRLLQQLVAIRSAMNPA